MQHATIEDRPELLTLFKQHKDIFPYLRVDYLTRKIAAGTVIWDSGIVLIYNHCKVNRALGGIDGNGIKRGGQVQIHRGDIMLSEMASKTPGSSHAGAAIQQFLKDFPTTIWLTVRADNHRACVFYENHSMYRVGLIAWVSGTIPGYIYCRPWCSPLDIPSQI